MRILALLSLALSVCPAKADTIYRFTGDSFTFVQGVYAQGDRVTGSFDLSGSFLAGTGGAGIQTINSGVVSYSFTDGHQTLTQANSTALFQFGFVQGMPVLPGTNGVNGNWYVSIQAPTGQILTEFFGGDYQTFTSLGASQAEILSINRNQFPGSAGTWTLQNVPVPEKGSTTLFFCAGLACVTFFKYIRSRETYAKAGKSAAYLVCPRDQASA